jgi:hypothetical protein
MNNINSVNMSTSKRQMKRHMVATANDYVERMAAPSNKKMDNKKSSMVGALSTNDVKKKKSSVSKAYIQAFKWSQDELQKNSKSSKQKKPATSVRRNALPYHKSVMTEPILPVIPDEVHSESESVPLAPTLRYNKKHGLPRRDPMSAPLPQCITSRSSSTRHVAERERAFASPTVLRYEKISAGDARLNNHHGKGVPDRRSPSRGRNVVAILGATTLMAICEHAALGLLQMTGLLSDFGLQFTAIFVKATFQALIVVYLLAVLHHREEHSSNERRRFAFHSFVRGHGDNMIAVDKLRAGFDEEAVFDAMVMTKRVADDEHEYRQHRVEERYRQDKKSEHICKSLSA